MSEFASINAMFNAQSIVLFGSVAEGKMGAALLSRLISGGFDRNNICVINPKGASYIVDGKTVVRGYTDLDGDLEKVARLRRPELAIIVSPAKTVPFVLKNCAKIGVKSAVIISSGFSEAGNYELEQQIADQARKYHISFIGPNCAGMANINNNLCATIEATAKSGGVSLISQSGAVAGMIMDEAIKSNIGIGKFASYGNAADLNETTLLSYMSADNDTKAIAMYVENVPYGRPFLSALNKATSKKPVVIIKSGKTATGQRAAMSHTGSLAGKDAIYDAAFTSAGAIRASGIEEMADILKLFSSYPDMNGNRVAIITNSGGPGVMTADKCDSAGLSVDTPKIELLQELRSALPSFAGVANPIDLTVEGNAEDYGKTLETMLSDYDAAIVIYIGTPHLSAVPVAEQIVAVRKKINKPICVVMEIGNDIFAAKKLLRENDVLMYTSGERAANAISALSKFSERKRLPESEKRMELFPNVKTQLFGTGSSALLEPQAMRLLKSSGICVPEFKFVTDVAALKEACEKIGYPLCMKVVSPEIIHKSDFGGVFLNVSDYEAALEANTKLMELSGAMGVIVYPMLNGDTELIMGIMRDNQFGAVIAFGTGGVFTEIINDVAFKIAPLNKRSAIEMIENSKCYKLLCGARGNIPVNIDKLADMLVRLSELPFIYPQISEIDLNPVFASGDCIVAADARIIMNKE